METPRQKLDAIRARAVALLGTALDDSDWLDEESGFTFGDLRFLISCTDHTILGPDRSTG
ncbi:hypothetical protein [Sphingomonas sp. CFBP 13720]|uniref:hypothetical protein n=1 Tax=Sphingomonas sp. CFBP 13720 TaxID=2775302 RepID=UPI001785F73D|nr:hypothetical protein [Sphingomonas sp. CFBP 13720]MBD8677910.1 hypothetical protein [Sphingomonas sp. CFBP 13720]